MLKCTVTIRAWMFSLFCERALNSSCSCIPSVPTNTILVFFFKNKIVGHGRDTRTRGIEYPFTKQREHSSSNSNSAFEH